MLRGLPASGKSTWAKEYVQKHFGFIRVNKDEMRAMLHSNVWSQGNEHFTLAVRDTIVKQALQSGRSVIVDDTNFAPMHEETLRKIAEKNGATFEIKDFEISLDEAILRDSFRENKVGASVIKEMHKKYVRPNARLVDQYPVDPLLPTAIICDIDGTIALMDGRSPFEWERVGEDRPNSPVVSLVKKITEDRDRTVIFMSGRDEVCRAETEAWLLEHGMPSAPLYMRPQGNQEKDSIIKRRLFDENIRGKYNIDFVLDDRNQVVKMWREMGLTVFQVADGDF